MKKHTFCLLLGLVALLWATAAQAQTPKIDLRHNGGSSIFTDINLAIDAAINGDTMYLPGGTFAGFHLNKKLAIIGVGYQPDSTVVTKKTEVSWVVLSSGSGGSTITGISFTGNYYIYYNNNGGGVYSTSGIQDVKISRCFIWNGMGGGPLQNSVLSENLIGYGGTSCVFSNCILSNNVIVSPVQGIQQTLIMNNVLYSTSHVLNGCILLNNIAQSLFYTSNCIFYNNINCGVNGYDGNGNTGNANILGQNFNSLFTSTSGNWYDWDYHLVNPAYNTGGTNGTAIGIYGGQYPWKDGGLPFTPHINLKTIVPITNSQGQLPITIRAKAQGN